MIDVITATAGDKEMMLGESFLSIGEGMQMAAKEAVAVKESVAAKTGGFTAIIDRHFFVARRLTNRACQGAHVRQSLVSIAQAMVSAKLHSKPANVKADGEERIVQVICLALQFHSDLLVCLSGKGKLPQRLLQSTRSKFTPERHLRPYNTKMCMQPRLHRHRLCWQGLPL